MTHLNKPIGIFDAGIGSYAIVERVRDAFPMQDILYLADRASFPYGTKSRDELLGCVSRAVHYLADQGCGAVILASNAPSIMVLDALREVSTLPVVGIFPPVREALAISGSKRIAVLGVASMVSSQEMARYVNRHCPGGSDVLLVNASSMVDLVENFNFLDDPSGTQGKVDDFTAALLEKHPDVDVMTLSSTHLPWLKPFFDKAAPGVTFIDPADSVLEATRAFLSPGSGAVACLATQTPALPASALDHALGRLGFAGDVTAVRF